MHCRGPSKSWIRAISRPEASGGARFAGRPGEEGCAQRWDRKSAIEDRGSRWGWGHVMPPWSLDDDPGKPEERRTEGPMAHPGFANRLPARETGAGGLQRLCADAMATCTWEGMKSWSGCTHQMVDAARLEETSAARKPSRPSDSGGCGTWGSRRNALVRGPPWDSAPASQGPYPWLPCGARAITQRTPCLGKI